MKFPNRPRIVTQRLCLRQISPEDREEMFALLTNEEVSRTYMIPEFQSEEEINRLFEVFQRLSRSEDRFVYGISLDDRLIGFLNDVEVREGDVELGYVIHPDQKGRGFATEALGAAMAELFDAGFSTVRAGAFEENRASMRVMEKCGMALTGEEEQIEYRGKMRRCICYAKRNERTT
jgi:RimJ/RimL family protein N-acetyltransferase